MANEQGVPATAPSEHDHPGELIAWLRNSDAWPLDARGADGSDRSRELFEQRGNELVTRREIVPIMMTNDPQIAMADCLFYAVRTGNPAD